MRTFLLFAILSIATPALANHPGERLDETMGEKEPAFESSDQRLPAIELMSANGVELDLRDLTDSIIVLSFFPDECGSPCAKQQALLVEVQKSINITPMREMVTFLTVASPEAPAVEGWNGTNWLRATAGGRDTITELIAELGELSRRNQSAPMVHIIARGNRQAAIFHGADFERINMILYINGLTNAHPPEPNILDRILEWLP
jgi:hypothetical protein